MSRSFANGLVDRGSIPGRVIPKTQRMVPDAILLNTQYYKVRVKWSNPRNGVTPTQHLGVVAIEKEAFGSPTTEVANFYGTCLNIQSVGFHQRSIDWLSLMAFKSD